MGRLVHATIDKRLKVGLWLTEKLFNLNLFLFYLFKLAIRELPLVRFGGDREPVFPASPPCVGYLLVNVDDLNINLFWRGVGDDIDVVGIILRTQEWTLRPPLR
jgi:hypothetical protein